MNSRNNRAGFTLIELMVVSALMAVISLALFSTFSSGMKLYKRAGQFGRSEDAVIFLERFSADAANTFLFSGIECKGTDKSLEMAGLVAVSGLQGRTIGRVTYTYDPQSKTLSRSQSDYSQLYQGSQQQARQTLSGVTAAEFSYYVNDTEKKAWDWKSEFKPEKAALPAAVRLEFTVSGQDLERTIVRSVNIPAGRKTDTDEE